jgi:hypothetical protein
MSKNIPYIEENIHSLMELSPSWEAANCPVTWEILSILRNPKAHYSVHKSHPLVPILRQINPIHTIPSYLSKIYFNIVHPPTSLSSQWSLTFFRFSPIRATFPSHPTWLNHCNYTWRRVQVMKLLIMQLSPTFYNFISLWSKYSSQHPVLKCPQSMFLPYEENIWNKNCSQKLGQYFLYSLCEFSLTYPLQYYGSQTWCSRVLLQMLMVSKLVKKFPTFYGTQRFIAHSHQPATLPYPELHKFTSHYFFKIYFNIVLSYITRPSK